jgi:hypothetical protein
MKGEVLSVAVLFPLIGETTKTTRCSMSETVKTTENDKTTVLKTQIKQDF